MRNNFCANYLFVMDFFVCGPFIASRRAGSAINISFRGQFYLFKYNRTLCYSYPVTTQYTIK